MATTRRGLMRGGIGAGATLLAGAAAHARPRDVVYAIQQFVGDVAIEMGRVTLDLPTHAETGTSVPLTVGFVPAPGEDAVPQAIHVLVDGNPRPHVLSATLSSDCGRVELSTRIRLESAQTVTAIAVMRDGRVWRADQELTVQFGACADVGSGTDAEIRDFKPVSRVSVPRSARRGEIVRIRTVISHPMETGLRLNQFNTWIPLRIVERFTCSFAGRELLRIRPHPAIATNPYFSFMARVEESGTFEFSWLDTDGSVFTNSAVIEVA